MVVVDGTRGDGDGFASWHNDAITCAFLVGCIVVVVDKLVIDIEIEFVGLAFDGKFGVL